MVEAGKELDGDWVLVCIEIANENRISLNQLLIDYRNLPPYSEQFKYQFVEWKEYIKPTVLGEDDPIKEFQFTINKKGEQAAVAIRQSGHADIYSNGAYLNSATTWEHE